MSFPIKFIVRDLVNDCWVPFNHLWADFEDPNYLFLQFTGEYDSDGREIYIGDLLHYYEMQNQDEAYVTVRWSEPGHDFHPCIKLTDLWSQGGPCKVIGNINKYEQKKLD